jgi:hypothetical protein
MNTWKKIIADYFSFDFMILTGAYKKFIKFQGH